MKTEDLIEAMNLVSPDYIKDTRPAPTRQTKKSAHAHSTESDTETVTVTRCKKADEPEQTAAHAPIMSRLLTGIAATAACAVFICGGWFISEQVREQHLRENSVSAPDSDTSENISETIVEDIPLGEPNFLGGRGEIHVMGYRNFMYDDTRFYFAGGTVYAERGSGADTEYHSMPTETAQFVTSMFYDGIRFYHAEDYSLYPVENDGTVSDTPFFTLTADMLPDGIPISAFHLEPGDSTIQKMTDDACFIRLFGDHTVNYTDVVCICHTDGSVQVLTEHNQYWDIICGEDGCIYGAFSIGHDSVEEGLLRIHADGTEEELMRFPDDKDYRLRYLSQHGDKLYFLLDCGDDMIHTLEYGVLDLNQPYEFSMIQSFSELDEPRMFANSQQDFIIKNAQDGNNSWIYRTDPTLENQQELFRTSDFTDGTIDHAAADTRYIMMDIAGTQYAIYDLENGTTQFFRAAGEAIGDITETTALHVDESLYYELDPGFSSTNFLGGQGSLHIPKDGSSIMWYDDTYFYYPAGCFPRESNQKTTIPAQNELAAEYQISGIVSSGNRLFVVKNGTVNQVDSSGSLKPFFRFADAGLTDNMHLIYNVMRLGEYYIFPCSKPIESDDMEMSNLTNCAYICTNQDGEILEAKSEIITSTSFSAGSSDGISEHVYYMNCYAENVIHRISATENGITETEFALPGYGCNIVTVSDDTVFYYDSEGNYCGFEPDTGESAVILAGNAPACDYAQSHPVMNGKLYYMLADPFSEEPLNTDFMELDLNTGEKQKILSFDKSYLNSNTVITGHNSLLLLHTSNGFILYNPQTRELFRIA